MRKRDVPTRYSSGKSLLPAVNVKVYRFGCSAANVATHFGCSDAAAERALLFWWQSTTESFWEELPQIASTVLPEATLHSAGRSGGWCVLSGLPELPSWDAVLLARYAKFVRLVHTDIAWRISRDVILEATTTNRWAEEGAEYYNFVDSSSGTTQCLPDLKRQAQAAGFGAVIRR
jgi:hypothetical protein